MKLYYTDSAINNEKIRKKVEFHLLLFADYVIDEPIYSILDANAYALVKNIADSEFFGNWASEHPNSSPVDENFIAFVKAKLEASGNNTFIKISEAIDKTLKARYDLAIRVKMMDEEIFEMATRMLIIGFREFAGIEVDDAYARTGMEITSSDEEIHEAVKAAWNRWAGLRSEDQGDTLLKKYTYMSGDDNMEFDYPDWYVSHFSNLKDRFRGIG